MNEHTHIDELLTGFIDGELNPREETKVQRLISRDPDVARRLKRIERGRFLLNSLPRTDAPQEVIDNVRHLLERRSLLANSTLETQPDRRHVWFVLNRPYISTVAAVVMLFLMLSALIYHIVKPLDRTEISVAVGPATPLTDVHGSSVRHFEGSMQWVCTDMEGMANRLDQFLREFQAGFRHDVQPDPDNRLVYSIQFSNQVPRPFLERLDHMMQTCHRVDLLMDDGPFSTLADVTASQVAMIVRAKTHETRHDIVEDTAVANRLDTHTVVPVDDSNQLNEVSIPTPVLAGEDNERWKPGPGPSNGLSELTLVLIRQEAYKEGNDAGQP